MRFIFSVVFVIIISTTVQIEGNQFEVTGDELAFYDALTTPHAIKDFYLNDRLIVIIKEFADTLCKNKTIDWQKRKFARANVYVYQKGFDEIWISAWKRRRCSSNGYDAMWTLDR